MPRGLLSRLFLNLSFPSATITVEGRMMREMAVFRGCDDIAVVLSVIDLNEDILYVTDSKGITELEDSGITRRKLGMSRGVAYRWDGALKTGDRPKWSELRRF